MSEYSTYSEDHASPESESGQSGVATPVADNLEDAINHATHEHLKSVSLSIVQNEKNKELASDLLLAQHPYDASKKRKAYEVCEQCGDEYNVSTNNRESCIYHPEGKEVDNYNELWADHDPDCHGEPDSFVDNPDYDEGFFWTCCKKPGGAGGCKMGKHRANAVKKGRAKFME